MTMNNDDQPQKIDQENGDQLNETTQDSVESINFEEEALKYKDSWMRALADLDNIRKRSQKEKEDAQKYGITSLARDILSVSDNMKRALDSAPQDVSGDLKSLMDGIVMIHDEIKSIFERYGIKEIHPLGLPFDPNFHQAMFEIPESADFKVGTVAQVLQSGYVIHERLLRPAMVGVAKAENTTSSS